MIIIKIKAEDNFPIDDPERLKSVRFIASNVAIQRYDIILVIHIIALEESPK